MSVATIHVFPPFAALFDFLEQEAAPKIMARAKNERIIFFIIFSIKYE